MGRVLTDTHSTQQNKGLVQIPRKLAQLFPGLPLSIEHAYGREFPSEALRAGRYRLVVHCGGCMIDRQKVKKKGPGMDD